MLKQTFLSSIIFISTSSTVFAKTLTYMGGSIGYSRYYLSSGHDLSGTLFAGRGVTLGASERFYLGGELSLKATRWHDGMFYGLSAAIIPGYNLTSSTMIYGRLNLISVVAASNIKAIQLSPAIGVGVQQKLTDKVAVRVEYGAATPASGNLSVGLVYNF